MVEEVRMWRANDGSAHETREAALRRELLLLVKPMVDSDAIAVKFVAAINYTTASELVMVVSQLGEALASADS